jgi:DMSO/TMAO reductase YedYZ molybdopterin-dependent catalytic subunit
MPESKTLPPLTGDTAEREMRRLTRRSFVTGAVAALAGLGAWRWLTTASLEDGLPWPLRRALRFNQGLAESLYSASRLAPTFPDESVQGPARTNGLIGLAGEINAAAWQLRIQHEGRGAEQTLGLQAVQALPRTDLVTELKCVEGWSEVMHFGGVRFLDFVRQFGLATRSGRAPNPENNPQDLYRYVYLATPDESYYVGLDMASALHPQTLLCDMMNWQPLTVQHGAPLRLYLAVKYGYKSLKRIGLIRFLDQRPADYWAERGYDWYAGH